MPRVTARDYVTEMRTLVDKETAGGPYSSRAVAERIVEFLRATDPDLLNGWLHAQAVHFVWQSINARDRSARSAARTASRRGAFSADAQAYRDGDTQALIRWLDVPFVVSTGLRMRLADMRRDDLHFVAKVYELRAEDNRMTAAFLTVVARKIGDRKVGEVFDDKKLAAAWQTIAGVG